MLDLPKETAENLVHFTDGDEYTWPVARSEAVTVTELVELSEELKLRGFYAAYEVVPLDDGARGIAVKITRIEAEVEKAKKALSKAHDAGYNEQMIGKKSKQEDQNGNELSAE